MRRRQRRSRQRDRVSYITSRMPTASSSFSAICKPCRRAGGPGKADIRLVVHGPALRAHALAAEDHTVSMMQKLVQAGVGFDACANTMKAQGVKLDDLTPGFVVAEKGGVVRLVELQQQGYAYLRP